LTVKKEKRSVRNEEKANFYLPEEMALPPVDWSYCFADVIMSIPAAFGFPSAWTGLSLAD